MKAIIYESYGEPEVLKIKEIEKPTPRDNEVLIKIHATTVTLFDCWQRSSTAPTGFWLMSRLSSGLMKPKKSILGTELAGEIESVGKGVTKFKRGDHIFGFSANLGTYAEYMVQTEDGTIAIKPNNMIFEEAAAVPQGALTALYFLRKANIQKGQKILIFGASGGVGTFAVQLAKYFGAEVTGVCSTKKIELVKNLGPDEVIDYTKEDFTKNNKIYDVIFDTIGKSSVSRSKKSLKKEGTYICATFGLPKLFQLLWLKLTSKKKIVIGLLEDKAEDLNFLKKLIEDGKLRSIIDKKYSMDEVVLAHKYLEDGRKNGQIVISFSQEDL